MAPYEHHTAIDHRYRVAHRIRCRRRAVRQLVYSGVHPSTANTHSNSTAERNSSPKCDGPQADGDDICNGNAPSVTNCTTKYNSDPTLQRVSRTAALPRIYDLEIDVDESQGRWNKCGKVYVPDELLSKSGVSSLRLVDSEAIVWAQGDCDTATQRERSGVASASAYVMQDGNASIQLAAAALKNSIPSRWMVKWKGEYRNDTKILGNASYYWDSYQVGDTTALQINVRSGPVVTIFTLIQPRSPTTEEIERTVKSMIDRIEAARY